MASTVVSVVLRVIVFAPFSSISMRCPESVPLFTKERNKLSDALVAPGAAVPLTPETSPAAVPVPTPVASVLRPKSKTRIQVFSEIGVAHTSTVRFVLEEMIPFGSSTYPEIVAAAVFPVVAPVSRRAEPVKVELIPHTVATAPETLSAIVVPLAAAPAALLKDQRFTSAAQAECAPRQSAVNAKSERRKKEELDREDMSAERFTEPAQGA